jgi:hypothetical protein
MHVNWLSENPNSVHLFAPLNHEKMQDQCKEFSRDLLSYVLHPTRLIRLANALDMDLEDYMEFI